MNTETRITALCPENEKVRVTYFNKAGEPLFFLTSPERATSNLSAQTGAFSLYAVTAGAKGARKAKKLGKGGSPTELEAEHGVREKMLA